MGHPVYIIGRDKKKWKCDCLTSLNISTRSLWISFQYFNYNIFQRKWLSCSTRFSIKFDWTRREFFKRDEKRRTCTVSQIQSTYAVTLPTFQKSPAPFYFMVHDNLIITNARTKESLTEECRVQRNGHVRMTNVERTSFAREILRSVSSRKSRASGTVGT